MRGWQYLSARWPWLLALAAASLAGFSFIRTDPPATAPISHIQAVVGTQVSTAKAITAVTAATPITIKAALPMPMNPKPAHIGLFVSDSPSDTAKSLATLDYAQAAGIDMLYNYASFDGTPAQLQAYLGAAQSRHIQIILSLQDLYDELPGGAATAKTFAAWGDSNEAIALAVVKSAANHPATYGFSITDERPESPDDLATWQPILARRAAQLRAITAKPILGALVGWTSPTASDRQHFLAALMPTIDELALDYYPVPFDDANNVAKIAGDLKAINQSNGWFIEQAFSWASYPETVSSLGHDPDAARYPTTADMVSMGRSALAAGAHNLLFYSYFNIASNPDQLKSLTSAVQQLRNGN